MTADATLAPEQDDRLFCFRHPERETWVRCGRCDRPICTKCGLMGPVGMRCKDCGRLKNDPLTSFTPLQLVLGIGVTVGAGIIGGYIAGQVSFFAIFIGYFGGGLIAEAVTRVTGYKRGPVMNAIVYGGILVGSLLGLGLQYWSFASIGPVEFFTFPVFLSQVGMWALIWIGAACAGAYSRLR
jgi:hypothetical protein